LIILGITTYLIGLALGSLVLAPLSEMYGRRPVYLIAVFMFTVLIIPAALAKDLQSILVTRFFGAIAGSAMISNAPGTVADIVSDEYRALAFSIWSLGPMNGPVVGENVSDFLLNIYILTMCRAPRRRFRLPVHGLALDELGSHDRIRRILDHGHKPP
jgi:MFS family permease